MQPNFIKSESPSLFFTHELIRKQLAVILNAEMFRSSGVLVRFLEFVVEETLQGRAHEIKEYTIGVTVLRRPASFNPQIDAIVRINAGRLRRLLKHYYESPGQNDEVRIDIPRGAYVPVFEPVQNIAESMEEPAQSPTVRSPHGLTVAIIPFTNDSADDSKRYFADGLAAQLCSSLASLQEFSIVAYSSSRRLESKASDLRVIGKHLNAQYLIAGSIWFTPTHFRLNVQLIFAEDATLIWTDTYERTIDQNDLYALQNDIISNIVVSIGSFNGVILQHLCQIPAAVRSAILGEYDALYWFYDYKKKYTPDALFQARNAIEETIKLNPHYSTAWAVYSYIYSDSAFMQVQWVDNPLDDAIEFAEKSLELNPSDHHGHLALAFAKLLLGKRNDTLKALERCANILPLSAGHAGLVGAYLVSAGEYDEGMKYLARTTKSNAYYTWCLDVCFSLCHFKYKDYEKASERASRVNNQVTPWGMLLQSSSLGKLQSSEALESIRLLERRSPGIRRDAQKLLGAFLLDHDLITEIVHGLELAYGHSEG
ncbi:MAG TPA: hypothetical protein VIU12_21990 [Chryseolinea sp.]